MFKLLEVEKLFSDIVAAAVEVEKKKGLLMSAPLRSYQIAGRESKLHPRTSIHIDSCIEGPAQ